jgi:hypothetical protein
LGVPERRSCPRIAADAIAQRTVPFLRLGDTACAEMLGFSAVVATLADWSFVRMDTR